MVRLEKLGQVEPLPSPGACTSQPARAYAPGSARHQVVSNHSDRIRSAQMNTMHVSIASALAASKQSHMAFIAEYRSDRAPVSHGHGQFADTL